MKSGGGDWRMLHILKYVSTIVPTLCLEKKSERERDGWPPLAGNRGSIPTRKVQRILDVLHHSSLPVGAFQPTCSFPAQHENVSRQKSSLPTTECSVNTEALVRHPHLEWRSLIGAASTIVPPRHRGNRRQTHPQITRTSNLWNVHTGIEIKPDEARTTTEAGATVFGGRTVLSSIFARSYAHRMNGKGRHSTKTKTFNPFETAHGGHEKK